MEQTTELERLKARVAECEKIIKEMSVPIISSIVENTILVPIVGYAGAERFELIRSKVLEHIDKNRTIDSAIFDYTGVDLTEADEQDLKVLAMEVAQLNNTLRLMDVRPISVGFHPNHVREIVSSGIQMEFESYINFKMALQVLLKEKNHSLN